MPPTATIAALPHDHRAPRSPARRRGRGGRRSRRCAAPRCRTSRRRSRSRRAAARRWRRCAISTIVNAICAEAVVEDVLQRAHLGHGQGSDRSYRRRDAPRAPSRGATSWNARRSSSPRHRGPPVRRPGIPVRPRWTSACRVWAIGSASASDPDGRPGDHADDREPRQVRTLARSCRRTVGRDAFADRILVGEDPLCEHLVDDRDGLAPLDIRPLERATANRAGCPSSRSSRWPPR